MSELPKQIDNMKLLTPEPEAKDLWFYAGTLGVYYDEGAMGFGQAIRIYEGGMKVDGPKVIVEQGLSGNAWGRFQFPDGKQVPRTVKKPYTLTWMSINQHCYRDMQHFLDVKNGKTYVSKGKRKPRPLEPMNELEVKLLFGMKVYETSVKRFSPKYSKELGEYSQDHNDPNNFETCDGHLVWAMDEESARKHAVETVSGGEEILSITEHDYEWYKNGYGKEQYGREIY